MEDIDAPGNGKPKFENELEEALISEAEKAKKETSKHTNKVKNYFRHPKSWIELAGVIILFAYTLITLCLWNSQQTANQTSSNAFIGANRPWISVSGIKFFGPLTFKSNGDAYLYISATATNFGHSPTILQDYFRLEIVSKNNVFSQYFEERAECNPPPKEEEFPWFGYYLIPNGIDQNLGGSGPISHNDYVNAWPAPNDVIFRIIGCVKYTFPSDPSFVGETGYSADITRIVDQNFHQGGFNPKGAPVSMNMVILTPTAFESDYIQ